MTRRTLVSDVAGYDTKFILRPGNRNVGEHSYATIESFDQVKL